MYIPFQVLKEGSFSNFATNQHNVKIFKDKVVSKSESPLLFNIELGLEVTDYVTNGVTPARKNTTSRSSRRKSAKKLLERLNVVRVNVPKDYSLLTAVAADMIIDNPNIENTEIFENTFNNYILAKDKFPSIADPFYKLDDGNASPLSYEQEKDENNKIMERVDMSKIAAGVVSLNMLNKYNGKSKYFLIPARGEQ